MPNRSKETSQVGRVIGAGTWKRGHAGKTNRTNAQDTIAHWDFSASSPPIATRGFQEALTMILAYRKSYGEAVIHVRYRHREQLSDHKSRA